MLKVNNRDTRMTLGHCSGALMVNFKLTSSSVSIVEFEQVNAGRVLTCSMLQSHYTDLFLDIYHCLKHADLFLLYHKFLQFNQFFLKPFSKY